MLPKKTAPSSSVPSAPSKAMDEIIKAPVNGTVLPLSEVKDDAFAGGVLGMGAAIVPENGNICAPCSGIISAMYPTGHAVGIQSDAGAEILIHFGMDTVSMNGDGFTVKVKEGEAVRAGDLLVCADLKKIRAAGLDTTTPVIVTNSDEYLEIRQDAAGTVRQGDTLLSCIGK